MSYHYYETIEVPLIYAQRVNTLLKGNHLVKPIYEDVGEPFGPFLSGYETSRFVHSKLHQGVYGILNQPKVVNDYRFFTKDTAEITFRNLDIRAAKDDNALIKTKPHTEDTLLYNMEICGYEAVKLIKFDGIKSIMEVKCANVDCNEKVRLEYRHLTLPSYTGAKCECCKGINYSYSKLGMKYNKRRALA